MTSNDDSVQDPTDTSFSSFHFGQLVWAKLGSAPFWPAVIFTEENQEWMRQKGKSTHVHVFFFGQTAERSWIQTTRLLPFLGTEKFPKQRSKWRRRMKGRSQQDAKLTGEDKNNLNIAMKQTIKLAKFSLRKRITVLKDEWWYWDETAESQISDEKTVDENPKDLSNEQENNETEEILELLNPIANDLVCLDTKKDEIIYLTDDDDVNNDTQSYLKHTPSVCFHPLTSYEEETIIREMISSTDKSFSTCRRIAEKEYLLCIQKNFPSTSVISEHWFYLFVFRHCQRLAKTFPKWIQDMESILTQSSFISPMHVSQIESLVILFQHRYNNN